MEKPSSKRSIHPWTAFCITALLAALLLAALCLLATSSGAQGSQAADTLTPITYATVITPGQPMVMGDTDVILEFAPGASGMVTVTLVPTAPVPPPPGGAISLTWDITTTATSYEVTATFIYSRAARDADIALVLDDSGSMEYDTLCYGCWEPQGASGCTEDGGCIYPLPWGQDPSNPPAAPDHCSTGNTYSNYSGGGMTYTHTDEYYRATSGDQDYYIVIEAEEYSSYNTLADYHDWAYVPYHSYWVIQRNDGTGAIGRDARGGYVSHHPFADYQGVQGGFGVSCQWNAITDPLGPYCRYNLPGGPFPAPRVDYEFQVPASGTYYVWLRGQGGPATWGGSALNHVFWGLDGSVLGQKDGFPQGAYYDGAAAGLWGWQRLSKGEGVSEGDTLSLTAGIDYTLNLWAGGAGFDVDRIVITTDDNSVLPSGMQVVPQANNARTDWACEPCDPRFGGYPGGEHLAGDWWLPDCHVGLDPDQRQDPIYGGEQSIRAMLGAAMDFASELDVHHDQIGYVSYDTNASTRNELECIRRLGPENCTSDIISTTVIAELNGTAAGGATNVAGGMMEGIAVLSTGGGHFGRPGAAHTMILLADGEANQRPDDFCDDEDLWPDNTGNDDIDRAKDCVIYYALEARDNGIVIHTISLGYTADLAIMQEVAEITGGEHRWAPNPKSLDYVFHGLLASPRFRRPSVAVEAIYHRASPTDRWIQHPLTLTKRGLAGEEPASWIITGTHITALSQWTLGPAGPFAPDSITVTGVPLSAFSSEPGTPSAEQGYTVSGSNLTEDIVITAPADFELSTTSGSGFTSSLTLTQSGGSVATTPIYVRFNRATAGSSSGDITHVSSGATTQNVAVSGTATIGWIAYNDCVWISGQTSTNITTYECYTNNTSGLLRNYADGSSIPVTVTATTSGTVEVQDTESYWGAETDVGTDAYTTFHGFANMVGGMRITASSGSYVDVTFTGLDPDRTYTFATTANRADSDYADRVTRFTLSGADAATNASTLGVTVHSNLSVSFCTGYNTEHGYVARWMGIQPGSNGDFTVRFEVDSGDYAYGPAVFMLQEEEVPISSLSPSSMMVDTPYAEQVFTLTLANNGVATDTFDLTYVATDTSSLPPGDPAQYEWVVIMPTTAVTVPAGMSTTLRVTVEIPNLEVKWVTHALTITATSRNHPAQVLTSTLTTFTGGHWDAVDGRWEGCRFDFGSTGMVIFDDMFSVYDHLGYDEPRYDFGHTGLVIFDDMFSVYDHLGENCEPPASIGRAPDTAPALARWQGEGASLVYSVAQSTVGLEAYALIEREEEYG